MSEENDQVSSQLTHAARNGLLMGFVSIVLTLLIYMVDISIMVEWTFSLLSFLLFAILTVIFGRGYRAQVGGFLGYGESFQYAFVVIVVSGLIGLMFNIILFNIIDPELPETMARLIMEAQEKMLMNFGASDDMIDETLETMERDLPAQYTPMGQLKSSWAVVLGAAILGSITAIFIKKKRPEFSADD
ncbi:MAG: DUF4199 domain-containing protein [Cyclobacteriaceae bacterium]